MRCIVESIKEELVEPSVSPPENKVLVDFVGVLSLGVVAHAGQVLGFDASVVLEVAGIVKVVTSENIPRFLSQYSEILVELVPPFDRISSHLIPGN